MDELYYREDYSQWMDEEEYVLYDASKSDNITNLNHAYKDAIERKNVGDG